MRDGDGGRWIHGFDGGTKQMRSRSRDQGKIVLEAVIVIFLAIAGALFHIPRGESRALLANENGAAEVLRMLGRAETRFRGQMPQDGVRYAFLSELFGESTRWLGGTYIDEELSRRFSTRNVTGEILEDGGYRFVIYLIDAKNQPIAIPDAGRPVDGFWIAYAWPVSYGVTGRRVFVADSRGIVRSWDNRLRTYGGDTMPPAGLAPSPEGESYPIESARVGWRRSMRWTVDNRR